MANLQIGKVIYKLRKEKGITQEQLGKIIGISTAAISKWENETSYPDITLLPTLATFFNVSIDKLLNFKIELSTEDIDEIYIKCERLFNTKDSLKLAIEESKKYILNYPYSYLLKSKISYLFFAYSWKAIDEKHSNQMLLYSIELFEDIISNCNDNELIQSSLFGLGGLYFEFGDDQKAIETLNKIPKAFCDPNDILVSIYIKQNKFNKARKLLQTKLYKNINEISLICMSLANSYEKDNNKFCVAEKYYNLSINLKKQFLINKKDKLLIYMDYLNLSRLYLKANNKYKAIEMLNIMLEYLKINDINNYNTLNEVWCFNKLEVSKKSLSLNLYENVFKLFEDPIFNVIRENDEFVHLINELEKLYKQS